MLDENCVASDHNFLQVVIINKENIIVLVDKIFEAEC